MSIIVTMNLASGQPPVAVPMDRTNLIAEGTDLGSGIVVKVDSADAAGGDGKAAIANVNGSDAVGVTVAAADQNDKVRIVYLTPGMVLKGAAAAELKVGDTCQFNATLDGFDDGTGTTIKVIATEEDADGDHKIIYGVLSSAALY